MDTRILSGLRGRGAGINNTEPFYLCHNWLPIRVNPALALASPCVRHESEKLTAEVYIYRRPRHVLGGLYRETSKRP